ncbi:MAG: YggS family pyridoxal phosphate-dependent enzyme [Porticoccaceae bacterium]|nr:YggS family pyridoxal phosphate-dependent enzyme [Porticoccaceae bacterium]|tara:strand:- start:2225 stop:2932 length:708 start_codon:yes stop_codon:yes gene_type:complete
MTLITERVERVRERITSAAQLAGREVSEIKLLAVSKTRSADDIRVAVASNIIDFGENYLQEAQEKIKKVYLDGLKWHFIGTLQKNKTRQVAELFDWVHSVDRIEIAKRLSAHRNLQLPPLNICLQINIDDELTKSGFKIKEISKIVEQVIELPQLNLRGLMAIPASKIIEIDQRKSFAKLRHIFAEINNRLDSNDKLDTLSMGMSQDLEAAILEGATIVRVGSDIFGPRLKVATN